MNTLYSIIIFLLLILFSVTGYGLGGGKDFVSGTFWAADLDRNEQLSRDEAKSVYNLAEDEIFERFDKNHNGTINFTEFAEFMQQAPWTS